MSLEIITSGRSQREKLVAKYMQEIRDIVRARLGRRELLRLGLVMGAGGLEAMRGMRDFKPYWAYADDNVRFTSPPNTPFQDPLPIPPVVGATRLNPLPTKGTNPVPSALTGFREAARPDHQFFDQFPPTQQHELIEKEVQHQFYPARDGVPTSPIWTFVDATANLNDPQPPFGLRIDARYGTPIAVRIHNGLPAENHGFGINQTSTHLHNGHTASESDGGPTHFYDARLFRDFHYLNVRAGFQQRADERAEWTDRLGRRARDHELSLVSRPPVQLHGPERSQGPGGLLCALQRRHRARHRRRDDRPRAPERRVRHPDGLHRPDLRSDDRRALLRSLQPRRGPRRQVHRERQDPTLPRGQATHVPIPLPRRRPVARVRVLSE